ncbi:hypothetical protein RHSIM_Rhsim01G0098600 [Rhododendron simsii]|uniref:Uncharacterized protein n=1 Tax=Rhododendron simsii TaxID=118357 RepID=A0A834HSR8_RHOSS|nr:hypothetical protein RHSIM_Rhsim01G0098600 [Rhododendron simsii]
MTRPRLSGRSSIVSSRPLRGPADPSIGSESSPSATPSPSLSSAKYTTSATAASAKTTSRRSSRKRLSGSSTEDREGPAGVVAREDREAPEYFSLEDLPESSGDELGIDRTTETVSRTEAVSRTESGAVRETVSSSPATAEPIRMIPDVGAEFIEAKVSFSRIMKFLNAPESLNRYAEKTRDAEGLN